MMDVSLHAVAQSLICLTLAFIACCRGGLMRGEAKRSVVYAYAALILGASWCGAAPWKFLVSHPLILPWPALVALAGATAVLALGSKAWAMGVPAHLRR